MLQRIQTVYLIVVILLSTALYFIDFSIVFPASNINQITSMSVMRIDIAAGTWQKPASYSCMIVINSLILLFSVYAVFKFKDRINQIKLCRFIMFLSLLLLGGMFLFTDVVKSKITDAHVTYWYGVIFPIIQAILLFMAASAIKKDDDIVRSADRLR